MTATDTPQYPHVGKWEEITIAGARFCWESGQKTPYTAVWWNRGGEWAAQWQAAGIPRAAWAELASLRTQVETLTRERDEEHGSLLDLDAAYQQAQHDLIRRAEAAEERADGYKREAEHQAEAHMRQMARAERLERALETPLPAKWGWWADEGGSRFDCEALENGAVRITLVSAHQEPVTATFSNFRVPHFVAWLATHSAHARAAISGGQAEPKGGE